MVSLWTLVIFLLTIRYHHSVHVEAYHTSYMKRDSLRDPLKSPPLHLRGLNCGQVIISSTERLLQSHLGAKRIVSFARNRSWRWINHILYSHIHIEGHLNRRLQSLCMRCPLVHPPVSDAPRGKRGGRRSMLGNAKETHEWKSANCKSRTHLVRQEIEKGDVCVTECSNTGLLVWQLHLEETSVVRPAVSHTSTARGKPSGRGFRTLHTAVWRVCRDDH